MEVIRDAGLEMEAYVFLVGESQLTAGEQVSQALDVIRGFPVKRLWLDCEFDRNYLDQMQVVDVIKQAERACMDVPAGIYTSQNWWIVASANSQAFNHLPLWDAYWDGREDMDYYHSYGGWETPAMKQFAADVNVCGINTDKNVYWGEAL